MIVKGLLNKIRRNIDLIKRLQNKCLGQVHFIEHGIKHTHGRAEATHAQEQESIIREQSFLHPDT